MTQEKNEQTKSKKVKKKYRLQSQPFMSIRRSSSLYLILTVKLTKQVYGHCRNVRINRILEKLLINKHS